MIGFVFMLAIIVMASLAVGAQDAKQQWLQHVLAVASVVAFLVILVLLWWFAPLLIQG